MPEIIKNFQDKRNREHIIVYKTIREKQPVSKKQLKVLTGLKLTSLANIVSRLLETGLICAKETGESSGGRKPLLYSPNPQAGYIIGIDIARMYTKVALLDMDCHVIESNTFHMSEETTWENTRDKICSLIDSMCSGIGKENILGIGVGAVGPIDRKNGIILNPANFPAKGWENVRIKEELESRTGFLTILDNGVNTSALAEYRSSWFKDYGSMVYIIAGVGLRLGIIANSQLINNFYSKQGSFGHTIIRPDGKLCYCGTAGCLEAYVSIPAIVGEFAERMKAGRTSSIEENVSSISFDTFCGAVNNHDALAMEIAENAADNFAIGLANLINTVSPELVILGGPLIKKCSRFYKRSIESVKAKLNNSYAYETSIRLGYLGDNATVIGGGYLVLDYYLK